MFFLFVSTAIDRDNAKHIVRITNNDGNSGTVGEGVDVSEGEDEAVGERCGVDVGEVGELGVDGLGVDNEPDVDIGLGVGVGFGVGGGDGLLLLTEL